MCNGSRLKRGVLAFEAFFRLKLIANEKPIWLTLTANVLASVGTRSRFMEACSN